MAISSSALAAEIDDDPNGYGYAAQKAIGSDQGVADLLNQARAGLSCPCGPLPPPAFAGAVLLQELPLANLAPFQAAWQSIVAAAGGADLNNPNVWAVVAMFFATTTQTYANLAALKTKSPCSRAEQLFGAGTVVQQSDVSRALGRGPD